MLSSISDYQEVLLLEEEIDRKLREYQKSVDKILTHIQTWQWNDPVSLLYHEIFTEDTILDLAIKEEEVIKDLERRQHYNIPPGYKDRGKEDEGIGDLLIWHTILEIGKTHKKSILFVSGEEKADWYQKSEGQPLYVKYELIDEFRRQSEGQSFHIVKFSRFLELYGASEKVIEEVRKEESQLAAVITPDVFFISDYEKDVIEVAVKEWLNRKYPDLLLIESARDLFINFLARDANGSRYGIIVKFIIKPGFIQEIANSIRIISKLSPLAKDIHRLIVIIIYNNFKDIPFELKEIEGIIPSLQSNVSIVVGTLKNARLAMFTTFET